MVSRVTCGGDSVPVCLCVDLPPESASPVSSPSQQKASGRIRLCCKLRQWIKAARKAFAGAPTGGCCPSHGHLLSTWSETEAFKIRYIYIYIFICIYVYIYTHIYIYIYIICILPAPKRTSKRLSTTTQTPSNLDNDAKYCLVFPLYDDTTPFNQDGDTNYCLVFPVCNNTQPCKTR